MISFSNEFPLTSLTFLPRSARVAATYLSHVVGTRGTDRSFFMNSIPQPRADTIEVYLKDEDLPQFPMISINKSCLFASLDTTYKDSRYDYLYMQMLGSTHNYNTLQRAFERWTISSCMLYKTFPLRIRKTSLVLNSSFISRTNHDSDESFSIETSFDLPMRFNIAPCIMYPIETRVSPKLFPEMIPRYFFGNQQLILKNYKTLNRVVALQSPLFTYKVQKSMIEPLVKPPLLKSLMLNLLYDRPEDIFLSWRENEFRIQYVTINIMKSAYQSFKSRVHSNHYIAIMAKFAFSFIRKAFWCKDTVFDLYKLSKNDITPRLYKIFFSRFMNYSNKNKFPLLSFSQISNYIHPEYKFIGAKNLACQNSIKVNFGKIK